MLAWLEESKLSEQQKSRISIKGIKIQAKGKLQAKAILLTMVRSMQRLPMATGGASSVFASTVVEKPAAVVVAGDERKKPLKKRKQSLEVSHREPAEFEERDAAVSDERQDVSPTPAPKQVKQGSSSAWETLMNVAALVPPLPTTAAVTPTMLPSKAKAFPAKKDSILDQPPCPDVVPNSKRWEDMFCRLQRYSEKVSPLFDYILPALKEAF